MTFPRIALLVAVAVTPFAGSALAQEPDAQECIDANPDNTALAVLCAISRGFENANQAQYDLENGLRPPRTYEERLLQQAIQLKQREERERELLDRRRFIPKRPALITPSEKCPRQLPGCATGGECLACR